MEIADFGHINAQLPHPTQSEPIIDILFMRFNALPPQENFLNI